MMLEIVKSYHGCGMNVSITEMQDLMPEEVEAIFQRHQNMMTRIFPSK